MGHEQHFVSKIIVDGKECLMECYLRFRGLRRCPHGFNIIDKIIFWITNRFLAGKIGIVINIDGEVIYYSTG